MCFWSWRGGTGCGTTPQPHLCQEQCIWPGESSVLSSIVSNVWYSLDKLQCSRWVPLHALQTFEAAIVSSRYDAAVSSRFNLCRQISKYRIQNNRPMCAAGQDSDVDSFNSLNRFIDRRLASLVAILSPCAADPAISSSLNSLANGATDFTCKAWVRASIALPLISRFAQALMRCALEAGRSGIYWDLHEALLEAACGCLRNAFKSLDDALRIVANAPNGPSHLNRCRSLCSKRFYSSLPAISFTVLLIL